VNIGPIVSSFEVEPARGVKLSQITSLADDIALIMKTQSVRISPIPGKSVIGIEVPNKNPRFVHLREVLESSEFRSAPPPLILGLGTDIHGKPLIANLADMPHLLVAGTTGSGKTVCLNTIILSILFNAAPEEVKFMMVDPKRVELNIFEGLPHLIAPVVTNSKKAARALKWVVEEMDKRYFMLSKAGVRNISSYNKMINSDEEKMSHLVVIIDELHDLMLVAQSAVEETITRLAQLSRAVGIHLVIATQRPSVDVITGVIKANLPCRISFQVSSKIDSRTILDANGAERLIGKGDLLFLPPGKGTLIRAQCSLVSDEETRKVADFLKKQRPPDYTAELPEEDTARSFDSFQSGAEMSEDDELYEDAVKIVMTAGKGSTSLLQRRLNIGYSRAARLLDMMEEKGIISPSRGTKPRIILKQGENTGGE
jgi:DNA segregation ATPase FtsK/SpoIIIE, S-DNA-T family